MDKVKRLEKIIYRILKNEKLLKRCKNCNKHATDLIEHDLIDLFDICNDCCEEFYNEENLK